MRFNHFMGCSVVDSGTPGQRQIVFVLLAEPQRYFAAGGNTLTQLSFMLIICQPRLPASSSPLASRPIEDSLS